VARINRKRARTRDRRKITELQRKPLSGFLICLDTIVRYVRGQKRYILLLDGKIENVQTDNGSEFHRHFDEACHALRLEHYWSRAKMPKDNAVNERFNRTLQDEFLSFGNATTDTVVFNRNLTEWLIEYSFRRPHQALGYLPPINFTFKYHKVLPMYPSTTRVSLVNWHKRERFL
jgi:transposase InsO family protein